MARQTSKSSKSPARRRRNASPDGRSASQKTEKYRFAQNVGGEGTVAEREYRSYATSDGGPPGGEPDVLLDVPVVKVDSIHFELDDLDAHVALKAQVLDLVKLNVGVYVHLGRVKLDIKGVEAQALLKVRLDHVTAIVDRVLTTLDRNPQLVRSLGQAVEEVGSGAGETLADTGHAVEDVGEGAEGAVQDVGKGAGQATGEIGKGASQAVEGVGKGAGEAVGDVGQGAGEAAGQVGQGAGQALGDVGQGAGQAVGNLDKTVGGLGQTVGQVGQGAGQAAEGLGQGVGEVAQGAGQAAEGLGQGVGEVAQGAGQATGEVGQAVGGVAGAAGQLGRQGGGGLQQGGGGQQQAGDRQAQQQNAQGQEPQGGGAQSQTPAGQQPAGAGAAAQPDGGIPADAGPGGLAKEVARTVAKEIGSAASDEAKDLGLAATRKARELGERRRRRRAERHHATEAALRTAKELGVDLDVVEGTGAEGRITVRDVREAQEG